MHLFKMGIFWNMAGGNAQSLACGCSPGPLWVKAEGIKEVFNSHRSHIRTFVQPNPIAFPGINAPEGLFYSPCGPKNVARKVTAIHCVSKDKPLDFASTGWGEYSNTRQHTYLLECPREASELCQPSAGVCAGPQPWGVAFAPLGHCPPQ